MTDQQLKHPTIEEDLARAKEILAKGKANHFAGTIYQDDLHTAYKLLESFVAEIERPAEPGVPGSEVLCEECAKVFCPHGERLHFHHDGCPACCDDEHGSASVPPAELQTECCDVSIATDSRFCPKCGWEARVKSASVPSEPSPEPPNQPIWQQFYDLTTWLLSEAPTARIDLGATQGYHDAMLALTNFRANLRLDDSVTHNESWWHRGRKLAVSPHQTPESGWASSPAAHAEPTRFDLLEDPTRGLHAVLTRFGLASRTDLMPLVTALVQWAADAYRSSSPAAHAERSAENAEAEVERLRAENARLQQQIDLRDDEEREEPW